MKNKWLLPGILGSVVLGCVVGTLAPEVGVKFEFLGTIFMNALKMMVLPLIILSLTVGIAGLGDIKRLGSMGVKTITYYILTTAVAVVVGIVLVSLIRPGDGFGAFVGEVPESVIEMGTTYSPLDVLIGIVNPNIIQAALDLDILPIIFISVLFGIAFTLLGKKGEKVIEIFSLLNESVMKIVGWIICLSPLGIFGLIAAKLGHAGGGEAFLGLLTQLGKFCFTVILGLLIHGVIILPLVFTFITRKNPLKYFFYVSKALLTAFATSSSSATLPVTMECVSEEAKVSRRASGVVLPVGATINMDGTALYEAVAALFIAQCYGISLALGPKIVIFLTATLAAIGAAGIPSAGLVTMVLVLQSVGLPLEGIGFLLAIDWFLDRCRTTVNVWGDSVGAAVVDKLEPEA